MTSLKQSILATLTYSDHFDYPLTIQEIHPRLIGISVGARLALARSLDSLVKSGKIVKSGIYYHLPNRKSLVQLRKERRAFSRLQHKLGTKLVDKISSIPSIRAIYFTGSLAVNSSKREDDIDLMIITNSGRLWTTRLILTLYTQFLGLRRLPITKPVGAGSSSPSSHTNKLCLNLYLDDNSLTIPTTLRSLYTAYELIQAVPIYDPDSTHPRLLKANSWISNYLPNFQFDPGTKRFLRSGIVNNSKFIIFLESLAYHTQLRYMKNKITREHISPTAAFFHPHNPGKKVISKLKGLSLTGIPDCKSRRARQPAKGESLSVM